MALWHWCWHSVHFCGFQSSPLHQLWVVGEGIKKNPKTKIHKKPNNNTPPHNRTVSHHWVAQPLSGSSERVGQGPVQGQGQEQEMGRGKAASPGTDSTALGNYLSCATHVKQPCHLSKRMALRQRWTLWGAFQKACRCCCEDSAALPGSDVPHLYFCKVLPSAYGCSIWSWPRPSHGAALRCVDGTKQLVRRAGYNGAVSGTYPGQTQEIVQLCLLSEQNLLVLIFKLALYIMSKTHGQKYGGLSVCFLKLLERWTLSWLSLGKWNWANRNCQVRGKILCQLLDSC